ncbi:hypothetical protein PENTCL1PPCAC_15342, partial [Pristionchus entomophagus]
ITDSQLVQLHQMGTQRSPIVVDKELENGAAKWNQAGDNIFDRYWFIKRNTGGQNIYFAWQPTEMTEYLARAAVQAFYQEKKFYDYSHPNFNHDASHFTNMIWKSTNRIGIAVYIKKFYNQHGGCHIQAGPLRPLTGHMVAIHEWPRGNTMTAQ